MVNKKPLCKIIWGFVAILVLLFLPMPLGAEISGAELANLLAVKDQISNSAGYKISFLETVQYLPLQDPNQGRVFINCEATWTTEGAFAMKKTHSYEHPPIFVQPTGNRPSNYDKNGNFMIVRPLEEHVLTEPNRNDSLQRIRRFVVDPNGKIVRTDDSTMLWRWPIDNPFDAYQFNPIQNAMGRGFSRHLGTVKSVKTLSSGLLKVTSQGSHGPGFKGTWELTVDCNSDYLVREAAFTSDGRDKPQTIVTSSGVMEKDGIKLAKSGVLKYHSRFPEYTVEVTDISKVVGPNKLYEEVLSCLNSSLPSGASIVDMRGEKHTMTGVE